MKKVFNMKGLVIKCESWLENNSRIIRINLRKQILMFILIDNSVEFI